jgi:hypothetical protein
MRVLEFRYINKSDPFDDRYPHWSRKWEYPTVLSTIKKNIVRFKSPPTFHNTCWGFDEENHERFKNALTDLFSWRSYNDRKMSVNCIHSDIKPSPLEGTMVYDITKPPTESLKGSFSFLINVSALEEIPGDHVQYIKNLYDGLHFGGILILTFDLPGLQLDSVENFVGKKISKEGYEERIIGSGAPWFDGLQVGLLVIQKTRKIIKPNFEYTGWELSPKCLETIQEEIIDRDFHNLNIIEFGSGKSTQVLLDFKNQEPYPFSGVLDTFDCDPKYAHPYANIREIISYDGRIVSFGNDYSFYDIREGDLRAERYNLVILDGNHGAGRSVAWNYLKDRLGRGTLVVIDDFDHYPFIEDFLKVFPNSKLIASTTDVKERWVIYEIISC